MAPNRKVSAALAFLFNPPVLILDEPTAGLDPLSSEILKEKIQREHARGKLILITSHVMSDLDELATDVLYLQDGSVQFYKSIADLKLEAGENKLGRVIAQIMAKRQKKSLKISKPWNLQKYNPMTIKPIYFVLPLAMLSMLMGVYAGWLRLGWDLVIFEPAAPTAQPRGADDG